MTVDVSLGLGSNVEREVNLTRGLEALSALLGDLQLSPVFESDAVGITSGPFYNLVVGAQTSLGLAELDAALKTIESASGRYAADRQGLTLDIDILLYGELHGSHAGLTLPRPELRKNAFVLWPLAELAPTLCLPDSGESVAALWQAYPHSQRLQPVAFSWREQALTPQHLLAD